MTTSTMIILFALFLANNVACLKTENYRPIVGILAQASGTEWKKYGDSNIETPYVGFLEQAGARVVPVRVGEPEEYYRDLFSKINGVLFPGGTQDPVKSGYAKAAKLMYDMAIEANDQGDHFPVWGTCLGFEQLTVLTAGQNLLAKCQGENIRLPLDLAPGYNESRLLRYMPPRLLQLLTHENITYNAHHFCLQQQTFNKNPELSSFYRVISHNKDPAGLEFISTMEAYSYPFYAIQWHAEKNNWDWDLGDNIEHSLASAEISQYMANFFVQSARMSSHHFQSLEEESAALIESGPRVYLGQPRFFSIYVFNQTHN